MHDTPIEREMVKQGEPAAQLPFDAGKWAEAFCHQFTVTRKDGASDDGDDIGLMIGWFANALMCGFDERARRYPRLADLDLSAYPTSLIPPMDHLSWAVSRWREEVEKRPLRNVHRRALDETWRQVISYFGADPEALIGPPHDDIVNEARSSIAREAPLLLNTSGDLKVEH